MTISSDSYRVQRGSATWKRRYEGGNDYLPAVGAPPPCATETCDCALQELWPQPGETLDEMKARLKAKYDWSLPITGTAS